jgi:hypothetical protein
MKEYKEVQRRSSLKLEENQFRLSQQSKKELK